MGVQSGSSFYHRVKHLYIAELIILIQKISSTTHPNVYVDCNWVAHYLARNDGNYIAKTIIFLSVLAQAGFNAFHVGDGKKRHNSKIASITRKLKKEISCIDIQKSRSMALAYSSELIKSLSNKRDGIKKNGTDWIIS